MTTKRQQQMNGPTNNNIEWIPRGLQNLGNTCFYNSTLQCLIATQPLADYIDQIQRQRFNGDGRVIVPKSYTVKIGERKVVVAKQEISLPAFGSQIQMPLFPAFRKFMEEANNKNGRGPSPAPLFQQISRKVPRFRGWNQQDAHELLRYLMDNLRQDEINHFENAFQLGDQEDNGPEQKKQTEERKLQCKALLEGPARPVLDAVFGGKLQQTVHCTRCHHVSVSTEPFFDISLPLHYNTQIQQQKAATKRRTTAIGNSSSLTKMEGEKQRASISERHSNKPQRVKSTTELPKMDDAQSQVQAPMIHNKHQREQKKREKKKRAREAKRLHKIGKQRSTTSDLGVTGTQQNDEDEEEKNGGDEEAANGNEQDNGQNGDEEKVTTQTTDETNSSTDVLLSGQSEGKIEDTNEMEDVQRNGQIPLENGRHNLEENGTGGDDEDDQQEEDPDIESVVRALNVYFDEANVEECSANQPSQKSVVGALRAFTWPEELAPDDNGYQCSKCGQKAKKEGKKVPPPATAFKRYLIMTPPLILTLHLKRFEQTGPRSTKKLNVHVQFPLLLDLAPFCSDKVKRIHQGQKNLLYSLYGVVCHSGGLSGGHYIAYVRARQPMDSKRMACFFQQANSHGNQTPTDEAEELERKLRQLAMTTENGHSTGKGHKTDKEAELVETIRKGHAEQCQHKSEWYYCSDSSVRKSSESEVLRSQAYLLFYERIY